MFICEETLDDVLRNLYPRLMAVEALIGTSRGQTKELAGVLFEITKPRSRLSRSETRGRPFSCIGELLWYLSRSNNLDFIRYYIPKYRDESEDGVTVYGGYGPRLFAHHGVNQVANIISLLERRPNTRRAVIQLFDAEDLSKNHKEVPCTTSLQFLIRNERLDCLAVMRSNDAYLGLPHDVFCFTMLQEIIARSVGVNIGSYKHFAGSMHLYESEFRDVEAYIDEAVQSRIEMPEMPAERPWPEIYKVLDAEDRIRAGEEIDADAWGVGPYWADIIRLLQIFAAAGSNERIDALKAEMKSPQYKAYIDQRKDLRPRGRFDPAQPTLRFPNEA